MRPTILVNGAKGKTGAGVVEPLRARNWPVRARVHREDVRSRRLRRIGADGVVADMHEPDPLAGALRGAHEDIARVAAALPVDPDRHAGPHCRPTGPALLSERERAAAVQRAVGRAVLPLPWPFGMFRKATRLGGAPVHEVGNDREYLCDHRNGACSPGGGVDDVLAQFTGQPAEDFETTARRYAAMPFARQTASKRLQALARFSVLPRVPWHKLGLASDDARRLEQHGESRPVSLAALRATAAG